MNEKVRGQCQVSLFRNHLFLLLFLLIIIVSNHEYIHNKEVIHEGQRTILCSWFSPSTFM